MQVSEELVAAARKGRRQAVVELLALHYPIVWRMAAGLTGRQDVARGVARHVMQRSLRAMEGWVDEGAPTRWFHHHTLLTTRRTLKHPPDPAGDVLLLDGGPPDPSHTAMIRALRALPMQQREAFILHHGEKLDVRGIAVAMDCSQIAAGNHLRQANQRIEELAGSAYETIIKRLGAAYAKLGPGEEMAIRNIRGRMARLLWPRRIARLLRLVAGLVLLAGVAWGARWLWLIVRHSMRDSG